jgi:hypothetical protein
MGNAGSADVILAQAETAANLGQTVIVKMNAPDLCNLTLVGPITLLLTNGSVTIKKDPAALVDQGFQYMSPSYNSGLLFYSDSIVDVTLKNINFKNIGYVTTFYGGNNVLVDTVVFHTYDVGVYVDDNLITNSGTNIIKNTTIRYCEFSGPPPGLSSGPGIARANSYNSSTPKYFGVLNNNFRRGSLYFSENAAYDSVYLDVQNNFSDSSVWVASVGWQNYLGTPANLHNTTDYKVNLNFENNTNVRQIVLEFPMNYWKIQNNNFQFTATGSGPYIIIDPGYFGRSYKIGLNDSLTPYCNNQTYLNGNNTFGYHPSYPSLNLSYSFANIHGNQARGCALTEFLGVNAPGAIFVSGNVSVRKCKIFSNWFANRPILRGIGDPQITATLSPTSIKNGSLISTYVYTGINSSDSNDVYVDFYKSNANGDLLDYLGQQYLPYTALTGYRNDSLLIPMGVTLSSNDRVAITLTGLHAFSNVYAFGTSVAFYPTLEPFPCSDCISSFSPITGKKYVVSAWVKENGAPQSKTSYNYPSITITFPSLMSQAGPFYPTGNIINGWQRLEAEFDIPLSTTDMGVKLDCSSGSCYFDDIRVYPFDGSMKSYVYDPVTMKLVAELDERNYATKYEYDEEGKLVRVKKETERGIMTIKESRNNTQKN